VRPRSLHDSTRWKIKETEELSKCIELIAKWYTLSVSSYRAFGEGTTSAEAGTLLRVT
jgi:hypothetical protein